MTGKNSMAAGKRGGEMARPGRRRGNGKAATVATAAFLGICFVIFLVATRATSFTKTDAAKDDAPEAARISRYAPPAAPSGASLPAASRYGAPAAPAAGSIGGSGGAAGAADRSRAVAEPEPAKTAPPGPISSPRAYPVAAAGSAAAPAAQDSGAGRSVATDPAPAPTVPPSAASAASMDLEKIPPRPRNLFPSLGISKKSLYVPGPEGHWAKADEVILVEVERLAATAGDGRKPGYVLDMRKIRTLKGAAGPESDPQIFTIAAADGNPQEELGLDPKTAAGRRLVFFLKNKSDRSFEYFALTAEDFKAAAAGDTAR
ncbi:MAG: hypothetical protein N3A38_07385 [Planctomycetota bacterium]|nr:hypothetical protein [Planctomycetota bacterium]